MSQPAVSVIIPCFNSGATLDEAVESVLNQTFQDFEIVVVNDGSTDRFTNDLLRNYCRAKTTIITTDNRGLAAARNTAIQNSAGKYILPLDADDRISDGYLADAVRILEQKDKAIIVYSETAYFGDKTSRVELPEFSRERMLRRNLIPSTAFFRRTDYDEVGGYSSLAYGHEDWDFWLSLLEHRPDGEVHKLPATHFYYRIHPDSMLRAMDTSSSRRAMIQVILRHTPLYERHGIDLLAVLTTHEEETRKYLQLENDYREIRNSAAYKIGSLLLNPGGNVARAFAMETAYRLKRMFSSDAAIKVFPNPAEARDESGITDTIVSWWTGKAGMIEIRINSPHGPLFLRSQNSGSTATGKWVRDGMTFYLQDVTGGLPLTAENTLATQRVAVRSGRKPLSDAGLILMYHRVSEQNLDPWGITVTPQHFAEHLEVLRGYGRPLLLKDLVSSLNGGGIRPGTILVTFDDGYRDNLATVKPLLEQHDFPATVFLVTGYIESDREFWWDELERILLGAETLPQMLQFTVNGRRFIRELDDATRTSKNRRMELCAMVYQQLRLLEEDERRDILSELQEWAGGATPVRETHRCLTREEVFALGSSRLVEIGAHTVTHPLLTTLGSDLQRDEIRKGKDQLEEILGTSVTSFAYPYGRYSAEAVALVRESGFECACAVEASSFGPDANRFSLPRAHVRDCDGDQFASWLSGFFKA